MGSLRETNPSLWAATAPAGDGPIHPPLDATSAAVGAVDVVVVGAGVTGLSTALALLERGATVTVVEAGRICSGVTAYTTAKVSSLHGLTYAGLAKSHGDDAALAYGEANQSAIGQV